MNFATRLLTTLATILGLHKPVTTEGPGNGAGPAPAIVRGAIRYQTRGGIWRRRGLYVLPRLPNGESYTRTPDRRVCSPEIVEQIKADALIRRLRRAQRLVVVDRTIPGFDHSPGLLTVAERLDRQARRAERKAIARGEIA